MSVQDLLKAHPGAVTVFIHYKTRCIGCAFERFCDLTDVARHYDLDSQELLAAIQTNIQQTNHRSLA